MCGCLWKLKEGIKYLESGVTDWCELSSVGIRNGVQSSVRVASALDQ